MAVYKLVATVEVNVEASSEAEAEEIGSEFLYSGDWSSANITVGKYNNPHGEKVYKKERSNG